MLSSQLTRCKPSFRCKPFGREIPTPPPRNHLVPLPSDPFCRKMTFFLHFALIEWNAFCIVCYWSRFTYPSICYWVFKDEEVLVLQAVSGAQIMECGAESKSEKKNKKTERWKEEETSTSLPTPTPSLFFLLTPSCAVPTNWTPRTGYCPLYRMVNSKYSRTYTINSISTTSKQLKLQLINNLLAIYGKNFYCL